MGLTAATEGNVIFPNEVFGRVITYLYCIKIRAVRWKVSDQSSGPIYYFIHFSNIRDPKPMGQKIKRKYSYSNCTHQHVHILNQSKTW